MTERRESAAHPDVLGIQAVLAPRRRDAAVQVGPRTAHVQLVLVGLRGDVVSHVGAGKQELMKAFRTSKTTGQS